MQKTGDEIQDITPEDRARIQDLLGRAGAENWDGGRILDIWLTENRIRAERMASQRLTRATWALAGVTLILAAATIALVIATFRLA